MSHKTAVTWPAFLRRLGAHGGVAIPETYTGSESSESTRRGRCPAGRSFAFLPACLRDVSADLSAAFVTAGDAVLLLGAASPGLRAMEARREMEHTLRRLAEKHFLRSAAECSGWDLYIDGTGIEWAPFARAEAAERIDLAGPMALISCLPRAHAALTGFVERTELLAAVNLGRVAAAFMIHQMS